MHSIVVKDYMRHDAHAVPQSASTRDVVATLIKHGITGAPVVDENKRVVGFVSEQDCIKEMLNDAFFCEEPPPVTKVMRTDVVTVSPNASVVEIAQTMMDNKPKNYPVVQQDGTLVGLISRRDILRALLENEEDCHLHHA